PIPSRRSSSPSLRRRRLPERGIFWPLRIPPLLSELFSVLFGPAVRKQRISRKRLLVEPNVFHAQAVINAVDHQRVTLHIGVPARPRTVVPKDRTGRVLRKFALNRPHHLLALLLVEFHRLAVHHLVELRIAVAVIVALRSASEILVQCLVRIIDTIAGQIEADGIVAAHDLGIPLDSIYRLELAVDIDLFQLVDQDYCSVPIRLYITRGHLDL